MSGVYTIDPGQPFLRVLAQGLILDLGDGLADALVLLPSRRACAALRETFAVVAGGRPMLLPRLEPVAEVAADEVLLVGGEELDVLPALPPLRRRLLLATLVKKQREDQGGVTDEHAIRLAGELATFLDEIETEEVDLGKLHGLVPDLYAEHWQGILAFLQILSAYWPGILANEGAMEPAARRRALLDLAVRRWKARPPRHPVVAAGITGTVPAVARLLALVARLPEGRLVLPGLDRAMEDADWTALERTPAHPQHGLFLLLKRMGIERGEVRAWPVGDPGATPPTRTRFLGEIMRPAETSEAWQRLIPPPEEAVRGLDLLEAPDMPKEALALALKIRETLETPGRRVALVTTDRTLARRVNVELERWGIRIDDTGGTPLDQTPAGSFVLLTARALVDGLPPVPLLAALKHPLAKGGLEQGVFRGFVRVLEQAALRGPRLAAGFASIRAALRLRPDHRWNWTTTRDEIGAWLDVVEAKAAPLVEIARPEAAETRARVVDLLDAHLAFVDWLASDETGSADALWSKEAGDALARFLGELRDAARDYPPIVPSAWPAFLAVLMGTVAVRPRRPGHPRAVIWGQIEKRLQQADRVLLAGLNEGHWPRPPDPSPWLNRAMRKDIGLPPAELSIGIAAHDLFMSASAAEVTLSRARKDHGGQPTQVSRWLARLEAVLVASRLERQLDAAPHWLGWADALDRPARVVPCDRPAPCPILAARPREIAVTAFEKLIRDPYAFYAEQILKLRPLEPLDAEPGGAERGMVIHDALETFVKAHPAALPADPLGVLVRIGEAAFGALGHHPEIRALWWPRFLAVAAWFVERERVRRAGLRRILVEQTGVIDLALPGGSFRLKARADRIEIGAEGAAIVDYKTGMVPTARAVLDGLSPQLTLTALILADGGFRGAGSAAAAELLYWGLKGGTPAGKESDPTVYNRKREKSVADLVAEAREGLSRLIAFYDDENTPYTAIPRPEIAPVFGDYDHLARIDEWRGAEGAEETP